MTQTQRKKTNTVIQTALRAVWYELTRFHNSNLLHLSKRWFSLKMHYRKTKKTLTWKWSLLNKT